MYRYFFLAKNNIRKQKGDMITFFILTLFASALIFISLSFLVGTGKVVDTNMKQINAADILVLISADERAEGKPAPRTVHPPDGAGSADDQPEDL